MFSWKHNTKERSPLKATSSGRQPDTQEHAEKGASESSYSDSITGDNQRIELISRNAPLENENEDSDDEDADRFHDEELTKAIRERLNSFRYEMHRKNEPVEEETKEVRVEVKKEMVFTIPMNTKDPAEVKQSIKGLVEYIEDKLNLTVDKILEVKDGPRLREAYEVLDDWYRERNSRGRNW